MEQLNKAFADRLARAICGPGGDEMLYLLQQAGMIERGGADRPAEPPSEHKVGIWERSGDSRTFVRSAATQGEWTAWANVHRIEPKQGRRRIVLLGESVARGWGYPAAYAPAGMVRSLLDQHCGAGEFEVIDLARNDMSFEIAQLALAAAALEPDLVLIFAGNNWQPQPPTPGDDLRDVEGILSSEGVVGFKKLCERQLSEAATRVVSEVCGFYSARQIPVVWIIPEWNLVDWFDGKIGAPVLDGECNRQWLVYAREAEQALERGDDSQAAAFAQRMIDIDQGTANYGLRMLADCRRRAGAFHEARRLLERARDARVWNSSHLTAPRAYSVTQQAIRDTAAAFHSPVVDLPRLFANHVEGLPDRRLFLDYCHLTADGIRLAMVEAASLVSELLTGTRLDSAVAMRSAPMPDAAASADAEFLAAIHNAHWWQGEAIVRYHCERAAELSPHVKEAMRGLLDLQTSAAPVQLSSAAEHLASLRDQPTQSYILRTGVQLLDPSLLQSIADVLDDGQQGFRHKLVNQWQERNDIARQPANLLSFYYLSASTLPQEVDWAWTVSQEVDPKRFTGIDYYRAYWRESNLAFCASCTCDAILTTTLRLPNGDSTGEVGLSVNGRWVANIEARRSWKTVRVKIPATLLREGINRLVVSWPLPDDAPAEKLSDATRRLARGENDALLQIFGEIHLLTVAAVATAGADARESGSNPHARKLSRVDEDMAVES